MTSATATYTSANTVVDYGLSTNFEYAAIKQPEIKTTIDTNELKIVISKYQSLVRQETMAYSLPLTEKLKTGVTATILLIVGLFDIVVYFLKNTYIFHPIFAIFLVIAGFFLWLTILLLPKKANDRSS